MHKKNQKTVLFHRRFPALFSLLWLMAGCGSSASAPVSNLSQSETNTPIIEVSVSETLQTLEPGLQAVRLNSDQGFTQFIEQGGAVSDQDVVEFLTRTLALDGPAALALQPGFGCSTLSVDGGEGWLFGRNFDWQSCQALVVLSDSPSDYASISTVNLDFITQGLGPLASLLPDSALTAAAYYAPLDGMNEKGLAVSVNMIEDRAGIDQNSGKLDLTTTTALRYLLNRAADVEEALELLEDVDLHASMGLMIHYAIADAQGRSVVVEYVDNEKIVTETPVVTNFYFAEGAKKGVGSAQSHTRYERLTERLAGADTMSEQDVRDALESVSKHHFNEFESTEWSLVMNQKTLQTTLYHREDYTQGYRFDMLEGE